MTLRCPACGAQIPLPQTYSLRQAQAELDVPRPWVIRVVAKLGLGQRLPAAGKNGRIELSETDLARLRAERQRTAGKRGRPKALSTTNPEHAS